MPCGSAACPSDEGTSKRTCPTRGFAYTVLGRLKAAPTYDSRGHGHDARRDDHDANDDRSGPVHAGCRLLSRDRAEFVEDSTNALGRSRSAGSVLEQVRDEHSLRAPEGIRGAPSWRRDL